MLIVYHGVQITGLSGAGKPTIGTLLYGKMKKEKQNVVLLDGGILRQIYNDNGFSQEDGRNNAFRTMKLCKTLTEQIIDDSCCIIAMFDEL